MLQVFGTLQDPAGLLNELENVQRKAAPFVNNDWFWESSPTTMIKELGWLSTELIRKINYLTMLYRRLVISMF